MEGTSWEAQNSHRSRQTARKTGLTIAPTLRSPSYSRLTLPIKSVKQISSSQSMKTHRRKSVKRSCLTASIRHSMDNQGRKRRRMSRSFWSQRLLQRRSSCRPAPKTKATEKSFTLNSVSHKTIRAQNLSHETWKASILLMEATIKCPSHFNHCHPASQSKK